jgi:uncharacterized membrane protein (Fun14 family)
MSSELLLSNVIPFTGSGLVGYTIGFALKKILKWILIIVGFLAGMFLVGVKKNDASTQIQHLAANVDVTIPTNINPLTHVPEKVLEYI